MVYSDDQLAAMMTDVESDLVERKETLNGDSPNAIREAICSFANDLPNHGRAGVVFIGVRDDGTPTGLDIDDALLLELAHCKSDGNILPLPTMAVTKHVLNGADVAVVTVEPSDSPPVRYRGRIWTRTGPRRSLASAQDERILNEKRRHGDAPFDVRPVRSATLSDLDLPRFQYLYLPNAFDATVLAANDRTVEERLAATKMIVATDEPVPTTLGILMLCPRPADFLPGAYTQFLRFAGTERADPIVDSLRIDGPVGDAMRDLDSTLRSQIRTSVEIGSSTTEVRRATHAFIALRELVRNAVMHRAYDGTHSPIHLSWFTRSGRDHQSRRGLRRGVSGQLRPTRGSGLPQSQPGRRHACQRSGAALRRGDSDCAPSAARQQPAGTGVSGGYPPGAMCRTGAAGLAGEHDAGGVRRSRAPRQAAPGRARRRLPARAFDAARTRFRLVFDIGVARRNPCGCRSRSSIRQRQVFAAGCSCGSGRIGGSS